MTEREQMFQILNLLTSDAPNPDVPTDEILEQVARPFFNYFFCGKN